ncbi:MULTISPECIES: MFS transporter [unclassified Mycolicibacterium]|uniref:MFS transporter n=1 Tax=unclassified Mycolicibacterium TaxID=2636767 RepID=UPI0012DD4A44|nr:MULTISPECIES: MFS transporter [unclassified Mycolicibacterium]MUL82177.1 MFS transporter [Mycolicibacterium sp. CBMA 329]MUL87943.1 MFS transporter [Mycolicibacterium sp. CBMA 331]MUM02274.1 MFS transporter [Mycolicibacterium sp. CBMA 334]MUM26442.1 MFS transporter [Mycolicibacterium sp. CBMA 295]MUM38240.1 MFS transporter [Mycolicibacterium sp. CBMA 247]
MTAVATDFTDAPDQLRHRMQPWLAVAIAVFCIGWGGNQFTPLLIAYAQHSGYTRVDVDILLGAYVLGLIPGLLIASTLSDRHGRRNAMAAGVISSALGSLVLAIGDGWGFSALFVGRLFSGVAVGIAMAVGSAWIAELSRPPFDDAPSGAGARRASICLSLGFGVGPLCAGLLTVYAPLPLVLTYLVHAALCVPVLWAVWNRTAETRGRMTDRGILEGLKVPAAAHRRFLHVVVPMAPWIFGSAAIAYAVVPALVADQLGSWALLYTVGLTVLTLGCGVLIQPVARRLDDVSSSRAVVVSMALMALGIFAAVATAVTHSALIAPLVAMLLGSAYGIAIVSGLLEIQRIAAPGELAGISGVYYSLAYLGFLLPAALAALAHWFSYPVMLTVVGLLAIACTAVCASGWAKHLEPRTPVSV